MTDHSAEAHLRAIRQLMERATVYRAISAPTALVGGALSAVVALCQLACREPPGAGAFVAAWTLVFGVTLAANTYFIWGGARRRGEPAISPAMKLALRAVSPVLAAGGLVGHCLALATGQALLPVLFWLIFYGLGLLATMSFAPRSIVYLGWAFLLTGLGTFAGACLGLPDALRAGFPAWPGAAPVLMGATFGGYHLVYAACVWPRRHRYLDAVERRPLVPRSSSHADPFFPG